MLQLCSSYYGIYRRKLDDTLPSREIMEFGMWESKTNEHEINRDKSKIFYGQVVHCGHWAVFARILKTKLPEKVKFV